MYQGIGVSEGLAIGKAMILSKNEEATKCYKVGDIKSEIQRVSLAFHKAKKEIEEFINTLSNDEEKDIIYTHIMMLEDPELIKEIGVYISEKSVNAEAAIAHIMDNYINVFENMDDDYLSQRTADIKDIKTRLLSTMSRKHQIDFISIEHDCVVIAEEILPSYMTQIDQTKVVGFISARGSTNSHSSIIARSLIKPMIIGIDSIENEIQNDDIIAIDGTNGIIYINPNEDLLMRFEAKIQEEKLKRELLRLLPDTTSTKDRHYIKLYANIGSIEDAKLAADNKAEGVGLFRTEFIYINRTDFPCEQEQYETYRSVLELMKGKEVVIRTIDIGADKQLDYLPIPKEDNPFLGLRGIRLCLAYEDVFKTHLRALLRASSYGDMKIMYPMIANIDELKVANLLLYECKQELDNEGITYNREIKVGVMIEVPSAAINSDTLARHADFFSIGTNDLIQYTTAADRSNHNLSNLYSIYDPGVLRLIKMTADNAHKNKIPISICGEAASDEHLLPIFLAMGIDSLSMSSGGILPLRQKISEYQMADLKSLVKEIMHLESSTDIKKHLETYRP